MGVSKEDLCFVDHSNGVQYRAYDGIISIVLAEKDGAYYLDRPGAKHFCILCCLLVFSLVVRSPLQWLCLGWLLLYFLV